MDTRHTRIVNGKCILQDAKVGRLHCETSQKSRRTQRPSDTFHGATLYSPAILVGTIHKPGSSNSCRLGSYCMKYNTVSFCEWKEKTSEVDVVRNRHAKLHQCTGAVASQAGCMKNCSPANDRNRQRGDRMQDQVLDGRTRRSTQLGFRNNIEK